MNIINIWMWRKIYSDSLPHEHILLQSLSTHLRIVHRVSPDESLQLSIFNAVRTITLHLSRLHWPHILLLTCIPSTISSWVNSLNWMIHRWTSHGGVGINERFEDDLWKVRGWRRPKGKNSRNGFEDQATFEILNFPVKLPNLGLESKVQPRTIECWSASSFYSWYLRGIVTDVVIE